MTDQTLLATWGLTTTVGYLATHAMGTAGVELLGLSVFGSIVGVWVLLMIPPVGLTVARAARRLTDSHHWVWVGLVAVALAANVGVAASGGGHGHDGSGHGGSSASGHGEPGHHAESTDAASASAAAEADGAQLGRPEVAGHPHPDGGHGGGSTPSEADGGGEEGAGEHAYPDGGHDGSEGAEARGAADGARASADSGGTPPSGGAADGHGGGDAEGGLLDAAGLQHAAYFHLWFLVGALGFAYSAGVAHGGRRRVLYGLAALLNAAMVVALVAAPGVRDGAFLAAAAVQGLPMLLDLPLRARQPGVPPEASGPPSP